MGGAPQDRGFCLVGDETEIQVFKVLRKRPSDGYDGCYVLVCYVASGQANSLSEQDGEALTAPGWPRSGKRHGNVRKYY